MSSNNRAMEKRENVQTLRALLDAHGRNLAEMFPNAVDEKRVANIIINSVLQNPTLQMCSPTSVLRAATEASQLGLLLDNTLGWAHLVPFWSNSKRSYEATMILGYRGIIHLALKGGLVSHVSAHIVHAHDAWEMDLGTANRIVHRPLVGEDRGEPIMAYAVAFMSNGQTTFAWLDKPGLERIQTFVKNKNRGKLPMVWKTNLEEMWKKSAIRRLGKLLPLAPDSMRAIVEDERRETVEEYAPDSSGSGLLDGAELDSLPEPEDDMDKALDRKERENGGGSKEKAETPEDTGKDQKPSPRAAPDGGDPWKCECGARVPADMAACPECGLARGEDPLGDSEKGESPEGLGL